MEYFEDWLGKAFQDLCFAANIQYLNNDVYGEYKNFFCVQSLEKCLKAYLISKNLIFDENSAKKYNHNLTLLIYDVIKTSNSQSLKNDICEIAIKYYGSLINYKGDFLLTKTVIKEPFKKKLEIWCGTSLSDEVQWLFYLLNEGYIEARYPYEEYHPSDYDGGLLYDRYSEYLNTGLLAATIELFKIYFSLFDRNDYDNILQYTYDYQASGYDEMSEETKKALIRNQDLYLYLISQSVDFVLNKYKTVKSYF